MVHGQDRVEDVIIIGQPHAVQAIACKQVTRVLDDSSLWHSCKKDSFECVKTNFNVKYKPVVPLV